MATQEQSIDVLSTEHLQADLKGRSVRGGLLTITSQGSQFLLQSAMTVTLARLLTPADFGIVAMVTAVTGLATAFADLGLSEATIQREEINQHQVRALFWINVAIGLGLMLVTAGLGPVMAWFYHEPRLKAIALVTSSTFLIGGLRVQHDALLKRQMRFRAVAIRDVASSAVGVALAILMAWRGAGYWAVVAFPVAAQSTTMVLSWLAVRWIPGLPRRGANVRSILAFGGNVAASYFLNYILRNADNVLIGWWWGATPLGLYSRAYNLLILPVQQLSSPVSNVVVPAFSRIQGEAERFARSFLRVANLMMWALAPTFAVLFVAARPVIAIVLGRQWGAAAPVFRILVIAALTLPLFQLTMWSLVSRGRSRELFRILAITSPLMVASFVLGLPYGIKGVALAGSLMQVGVLPWILTRAFRGTNLTLTRVGQAILCPIALSLGGLCSAELALHVVVPQGNISELLITALGFAVALLIFALLPAVREEIKSFREIIEATGFRLPQSPSLSIDAGSSPARRIPVLLYHSVGPHRRYVNPWTVSAKRFETHVAFMAALGYKGIRPSDWLAWTRDGTPLPKKPVLVTFDDAYADLTVYALPVLQRYGFTATVFVPSALVGGTSTLTEGGGCRGQAVMTTAQIREWARSGIEFGAHSRTHAKLPMLTEQQLADEVDGSKAELSDILDGTVASFAYPHGLVSEAVRDAARRSFTLAFTTEEGLNSEATDPHMMRRTQVGWNDSVMDIAFRLRFGRSPIDRIRAKIGLAKRWAKAAWRQRGGWGIWARRPKERLGGQPPE